jgi:hypothetical protein
MAHDPISPAASGALVLAHLNQVELQRQARAVDPDWDAKVIALKAYQRERFILTHADLLADPRYTRAARFFLEDLYGPQDFGQRDAQFARIVPALVRLFPHEVVTTVESLAELHALSEALDGQMARALPATGIDSTAYHRAWQATGRPVDRARQIDLVLALGTQLDHYTRNRLLRNSLRLMRGPARAAGLGELQAFLERGFDTFGAMSATPGGSAEFLRRVESREQALMQALFETPVASPSAKQAPALGQLP